MCVRVCGWGWVAFYLCTCKFGKFRIRVEVNFKLAHPEFSYVWQRVCMWMGWSGVVGWFFMALMACHTSIPSTHIRSTPQTGTVFKKNNLGSVVYASVNVLDAEDEKGDVWRFHSIVTQDPPDTELQDKIALLKKGGGTHVLPHGGLADRVYTDALTILSDERERKNNERDRRREEKERQHKNLSIVRTCKYIVCVYFILCASHLCAFVAKTALTNMLCRTTTMFAAHPPPSPLSYRCYAFQFFGVTLRLSKNQKFY